MGRSVSEKSFEAPGLTLKQMNFGVNNYVPGHTHFVLGGSGKLVGFYDSWRKAFQTPVFYESDRKYPTKEDHVVENAMRIVLGKKGLCISEYSTGGINRGGLSIVASDEGDIRKAVELYNKLKADGVDAALKSVARAALKGAIKSAAKEIEGRLLELYSE